MIAVTLISIKEFYKMAAETNLEKLSTKKMVAENSNLEKLSTKKMVAKTVICNNEDWKMAAETLTSTCEY